MRELSATHPELMLVAATCRWPHDAAYLLAIRDAISPIIDWDRVVDVARRHRVVPLVYRGLKAAGAPLPAAIADLLQREAMALSMTALRMAGESVRLQTAFETAGLPACIVKGSPMALLAYGDLGAKQSWDIDLFCRPQDVSKARILLEAEGYELRMPHPFDHALMARFAALEKECGFYHPTRDIWVELHWRLVDNPTLLPDLTVDGDTQDVLLGGARLRTLGDGPLLAYLSVHGTLHGWSRLKWLVDLAAWLRGMTAEELTASHEAAQQLGAGRAPAVALLLSRHLLGLNLPPRIAQQIERDRIAKWLANHALAIIAHGSGALEVRPFSWLSWQDKISSLLLANTMRHVTADLRRQWTSADDRMAIRLPARLDFLYHALRLPLWLWRRVRPAPRDD